MWRPSASKLQRVLRNCLNEETAFVVLHLRVVLCELVIPFKTMWSDACTSAKVVGVMKQCPLLFSCSRHDTVLLSFLVSDSGLIHQKNGD